jgi:soluble lytic murein transglycosylase
MRIIINLSIILLFFALTNPALADYKQEEEIFRLIKQKQWSSALKLAKQANNRPLMKIALSQKFLDDSANSSFEEVSEFLFNNPNWPQKAAIQVRAENLMHSNIYMPKIISFFEKFSPITGNGYKYRALAYGTLRPNAPETKNIIKLGWQRGCFTATEQEAFLAKYKKFITQEDHVKKIDYTIAKENFAKARKLYSLVNKSYHKSFETNIALIQGKSHARANFHHISHKYYTAGLISAYLHAQRKSSPDSTYIAKLIEHAKYDDYFGDAIWKSQQYLAREYIEHKKYKASYNVARGHFATSAADKSEAEFLMGWLSLRFLNQPKQALMHFERFSEVVKTAISKARGGYWLARVYEALNNKQKALSLYEKTANQYPFTFYGQMSAMELNYTSLPFKEHHHKHNAKDNTKLAAAMSDLFHAAAIVSRLGSNGLAQAYIKAATESAGSAENTHKFAHILASHGSKHYKTHHLTWLGKHATQKNILLLSHAYPTPYTLKAIPIKADITYSIIRQESVFDHNAVSSADARGLMQIIPPTACKVASSIGGKCQIASLTSNPHYNITLGTNYLNQLINDFDQSYILAIASYNAGPHNVKKWIAKYGDPRAMKNTRQVIDWLELIPYFETRAYVQRVLENLQIYRHILNDNANFNLREDLLNI